jgi:hypothetical protein
MKGSSDSGWKARGEAKEASEAALADAERLGLLKQPDRADEIALAWEAARDDDVGRAARERLAWSVMKFAFSVANGFVSLRKHAGVSIDDAFQEAFLSCFVAAGKYHKKCEEIRFVTFCGYHVFAGLHNESRKSRTIVLGPSPYRDANLKGKQDNPFVAQARRTLSAKVLAFDEEGAEDRNLWVESPGDDMEIDEFVAQVSAKLPESACLQWEEAVAAYREGREGPKCKDWRKARNAARKAAEKLVRLAQR